MSVELRNMPNGWYQYKRGDSLFMYCNIRGGKKTYGFHNYRSSLNDKNFKYSIPKDCPKYELLTPEEMM